MLNLTVAVPACVFIWLLALLFQIQENRAMRLELGRLRLPPGLQGRILRMAWSRSLGIMLLLGLFAGATLGLGWKVQVLEMRPRAAVALPPVPAVAVQARAQPEPAPQDPVTQIFDGAEENTAAGRLNEIKKRYENLFINYFFHSRCNGAQPEDYYLLNSMFLRELASINGPSRMQADTLTAARGSYREVYANIPCDGAQDAMGATQFRSYLNGLRAQEIF